MARINLEQVWWTDPRREKLGNLLGSMLLADAVAIRAWKLAQDFWGNNRGLIPTHVFETLEANSKLIQANLAEVRENGVYIRGSSQYLDWVAEKREAAKKGGKKSAERPRDSKGKLLKRNSNGPSKVQAKPNSAQASGSGSGSFSDSGSNSGSQGTPLGQTEDPSDNLLVTQPENKANKFIAGYCNRFRDKYGTNPHIDGKSSGIAKRISEGLSLDKIELYLDAFFQMPDAKLIKEKHPMNQFEFKLNEIVVFANTGNFTTHRQAQQADDSVSNMILLQEIREGKR